MSPRSTKLYLTLAAAAAVSSLVPDALAQAPSPVDRAAVVPSIIRKPRKKLVDPPLHDKHSRALARVFTPPGTYSPARSFLSHGMEAEPEAQFQLRRELFFALSRLMGEPSLRRAALGMRQGYTLRALMNAEADEKLRRRATYVEIEQFKGTSPRPVSQGTEVALATTGAALFTAGAVVAGLQLSKTITVRPHPWPAGLYIDGQIP